MICSVFIFTSCENTSSIENQGTETLNLTNQEKEYYWFYVRTSSGGFYDVNGFHYSQILKCSQKVSTPGKFSKLHAVGPFETYNEASAARKDEIETAERTGLKLIPEQAVCDTKWK